jgi:hypothetical protein
MQGLFDRLTGNRDFVILSKRSIAQCVVKRCIDTCRQGCVMLGGGESKGLDRNAPDATLQGGALP